MNSLIKFDENDIYYHSYKATHIKGYPSCQALFQIYLDSKILLNDRPEERPLLHCRTYCLLYYQAILRVLKD